MTWSYTPGDLATSEKDEVRFRIGDTDTNEQLLTDEEINFAISIHDNTWGACAECAEAIASQFAKRVNTDAFDLGVDLAEKQEHFEKLAERFRKKAIAGNEPIVPSISDSDKDSQEDRTDRVAPRFKRGMHDNS